MAAMEPAADTSSRKRGRDIEDGAHGPMSFSEHRNKRVQFQISPKPSFVSQANITPSDSEPEDAGSFYPRQTYQNPADSAWSSSSLVNPQRVPTNLEPTIPQFVESNSGMGLAPPSQNRRMHFDSPYPQPTEVFLDLSPSGRLPTPIKPNFAAQVRGNSWSGPGPALNNPSGVVNMGHEYTGLSLVNEMAEETATPCADASMDLNTEWQYSAQQRRLPSPITEDGDSMCGSPGAMSHSPSALSSHHSFASIHEHENDHEAMEHDMIIEGEMDPNTEGFHMASPPHLACAGDAVAVGQSPSWKGHNRSRHTVNSWTWQPGMKKSFSIGYRSDCEKCRLKVPGHFNHIIIS